MTTIDQPTRRKPVGNSPLFGLVVILGGKDFFERDGAWDGVQRFFVDTYWYIKRKLGHPIPLIQVQELLGTPLSKKNRREKNKVSFLIMSPFFQ